MTSPPGRARRGAASTRTWSITLAVALLAGVLPLMPRAALAQGTGPAARLEARLDGVAGDRASATHAGGGIALPLGTYARLAALAGAGVARVERPGAEDDVGFSARADLLVRFHGDPIRQSRWGPYAAAGVSGRADPDACCDGYLTLLIGLEGPDRGGRSWALEIGLSGGVRVGAVLRWGGARWR